MVSFLHRWVGMALQLLPLVAILALLNASEAWWFVATFLVVLRYYFASYLARQESATMTAMLAAIESGTAKVTKVEIPSKDVDNSKFDKTNDVTKAGD